jgi:hypothetical protein
VHATIVVLSPAVTLPQVLRMASAGTQCLVEVGRSRDVLHHAQHGLVAPVLARLLLSAPFGSTYSSVEMGLCSGLYTR